MESKGTHKTTHELSPVKRAYIALQEMEQRCARLEQQHHGPIAIVGMACRFPGGANSAEAYWQVLDDARDAVGPIPAGRWGESGRSYKADEQFRKIVRGGFLAEPIDEFDAKLFGISPREAEVLDPQQRLLLEVSWEALEHAGQMKERLAPSRTGVFVGITSSDYSDVLTEANEAVDTYHITGISLNAAAGRLAFTMGFQGPSMAIDTACSSSLVAVHQACRSLLAKECDRAIAGGVNLILSPRASLALAASGVLSEDGRCKAFAADADGMVRGEGCGMVVLKRLQDAEADGDNILAVVQGSAVNQDGASSGLTVPNGPSQEDVVRRALKSSQLSPDEIDYIEAHGTGTSLGDPIEATALCNVFQDRQRPLLLGSVKTNLGHLEAASGVAGMIKVVQSLQHQVIPPQLHCDQPSPHIQWDDHCLKLTREHTPWPESSSPRIAGVSSFGFSGTNAHVIISEAPARTRQQRPPKSSLPETVRDCHLLTLSAKTPSAFSTLAGSYATRLEELVTDPSASRELEEQILAGICHTANSGRRHWRYRAALIGSTTSQIQKQLADLTRSNDVAEIQAQPPALTLRLDDSSQALNAQAQWISGLCRVPAIRQSLETCDVHIQSHHGLSLLSGLLESPDLLDYPPLSDAAAVAITISLGRLWSSLGASPARIISRGISDLAAGCLGGLFRLEDALDMAVLHHRPAQWQSLLSKIEFQTPQVPIELSNDTIDLRKFVTTFSTIEKSNRRVLDFTIRPDSLGVSAWTGLMQQLAKLYRNGVVIDWDAVGLTAGDERQPKRVVLPTYPFQRERHWVQRRSTADAASSKNQVGSSVALATPAKTDHPLLGKRISLAGVDEIRFESQVSPRSPSFITEHRVFGNPVFPAAAWLEIALAVGAEVFDSNRLELLDVHLIRPLEFSAQATDHKTLQTVLKTAKKNSTARSFEIYSLQSDDSSWTLHATGVVAALTEQTSRVAMPTGDIELSQGTESVEQSVDQLYLRAERRGVTFGPRFRTLQSLSQNQDSICGIASLRNHSREAMDYIVHPALLDGCFHILACLGADEDTPHSMLPTRIGRLQLFASVQDELHAHLRHDSIKAEGANRLRPERLTADMPIFNADGKPVVMISGLELTEVNQSVASKRPQSLNSDLYRLKWVDSELGPAIADDRKLAGERWLVLADTDIERSSVEAITTRLRNSGACCEFRIFDWHDRETFLTMLAGESATHCLLMVGNQAAASEVGDDSADVFGSAVRCCSGLTHFVQACDAVNLKPATWIVTGPQQLASRSAAWGWFRSANLELPHWKLRYLECDDLDALLHELVVRDDELHVAWRDDRRQVARIEQWNLDPKQAKKHQVAHSQASYLITGGMRGLGLEVARWLSEQGAEHLVLAGRSKPSLDCERVLSRLRDNGTEVETVSLDVANRAQVLDLKRNFAKWPLRGIVHCAGVVEDGILLNQSAEKISRVLAPKVAGAWHLHELSAACQLDFFLLFSSASSMLGAAGQSSYAAGNAFLDALAVHRREQGLPATSINWGPWTSTGMVARNELQRAMDAHGIRSISTNDGLQLLGDIIAFNAPAGLAVLPGDWVSRHCQTNPSLLRDLVNLQNTVQSDEQNGCSLTRSDLLSLTPNIRTKRVVSFLQNLAGNVLRLPADQVRSDEPLNTMGIDSLMSVELRNRVAEQFEINIPVVKFMDGSNIRDLANLAFGQLESENHTLKDLSSDQSLHDLEISQLNAQDASALLSHLDELSDEQVEMLLNAHHGDVQREALPN